MSRTKSGHCSLASSGGLRTGRAVSEEVLGAMSFRRFNPSKWGFSDVSFPT